MAYLKWFFAASSLLLGVVAVYAEEVRNVEFRTIAFDVWPDVPAVSYLDAEGQVSEIQLSKLSFSQECTSRVGSALNFFDAKKPIADDQAAREGGSVPVATVPLASTADEFILVFVPVQVDGRRFYRVQPIPSGESAFKRGSVMFVNLSEYAMVAKIGEEKIKLPVGTPSLVPYQGDSNRFNGQIQVAVYLENSWRMFYSAQWTLPESSKTVVMIYKNTQTGFPLLRSVSYKI